MPGVTATYCPPILQPVANSLRRILEWLCTLLVLSPSRASQWRPDNKNSRISETRWDHPPLQKAPVPQLSPFIAVLKGDVRPYALGSMADIYRGRLPDSRVVAIKEIRGLQQHDPSASIFVQNVEREAISWIGLHHNNIAPFLGLSKDSGSTIALISVFYPEGNIMTYVKNAPKAPKGGLILGIVTGLEYLHKHSVVHGDLRGSNVLIDDEGRPRLIDFGLARFTSTTSFTTANIAGPCRWQAPELFEDQYDTETLPWTAMSDVYALGMLALEILSESKPFKELRQDTSVILSVMRGTRPRKPEPSDMPNDTSFTLLNAHWGLLNRCWATKTSERPTLGMIQRELEAKPDQHPT